MSRAQIIRAPDGSELVVLPRADYDRLRAMAEERLDFAASRAVLRGLADGTMDTVPQAVMQRLAAGENAVRVWRDHRGLTVAALAAAAGLSQPFVSQIETGTREPTVRTLVALARALGVELEELVAGEE